MGVLINWLPDDLSISTDLTLCDSSRSIEEHNLKLNNSSLIEIAELYKADFIKQFNRYNDRVEFSFQVTRDADFLGNSYVTPENAFFQAALHVGAASTTSPAPAQAVRGTGRLQLTLNAASGGPFEMTFLNAAKRSIVMSQWMGIAITFDYTFMCSTVSSGLV